METMSYPYSPLISFPVEHEESSSYLPWSPQVVLPYDDSCHDQDEFLDMVQDDHLDTALQACDERLICRQEKNGDLVAIQEELMEENSLSDLLLAGAEAVEAGDWRLASAMVSRLDDLLLGQRDNVAAGSFDRLAYYFARGLRSRISSATGTGDTAVDVHTHACHPMMAPVAAVDSMSVYQMVQELSPFVKFAHFTANQAILEATEDDREVHVVDFNIGEGIQWPPLMSDLARRGGAATSFRLTAITTNSDDTTTVGRRLSEFADSINLTFHFNYLSLHNEEDLEEVTQSCKGSVLACCNNNRSLISKLQLLLGSVTKLRQPKMVILVEEELLRSCSKKPPTSFVEFFCEALHHFTAVFESLASCFSGGYGVCLRLVEREMVGPRIEDSVGRYESMTGGAAAGVLGLGFRACGLSGCNVAQAKFLVGLFNRGFRVMHENGRLVLCWESRPLTSVSVWTPM